MIGPMNYPFADRAAEDERLVAQGRLFDPLTRRLLEQAGLSPGMRVLDLGSGAGNVARLAAELVGPDGAVVGIERDPAAAELARRRTDAPNVEFRVGDVQALDGVEGGFDAVTGRLVLMYLTDPVAVLRRAAELVRPVRLICMHEADLDYLSASPLTPLWTQVHGYFMQALEKAGFAARMGPPVVHRLPGRRAARPQLLVEAFAARRPGRPGLGLGQRDLGDGAADGAARRRHPGRGGPAHAGRPAAGRDTRPGRLCHRAADDRRLGQAASRRLNLPRAAGRRSHRTTTRTTTGRTGSARHAERGAHSPDVVRRATVH